MEYMRFLLSRMRGGLQSPLLSLPFLSLSLPSPLLTAANNMQPTASATASRYDLLGTGAAIVSVAQYQANELIEDRWVVAPSTSRTSLVPLGGDLQIQRSSPPFLFAAVMDGHGGWQAAEYTKKSLPAVLHDEFRHAAEPTDPHQVGQVLTRAFGRTDRAFIDSIRGAFQLGFGEVARVGCCALGAVVTKDWIAVANSGDCRAVVGHVSRSPPEGALLQAAQGDSNESNVKSEHLSKSEADPNMETLYVTALPLSDDHNARLPREVARLRAAHPGETDIVVCKSPTACYVKGRLQPTRAIGDAYLKHSEFNGPPGTRHWGRHIPPPYTPPYITSTPEVKILWLCNPSNRQLQHQGPITEPTLDISGARSDLPDRHTFLILACDGIWDVLSNEDAVRFVAEDDGDAETVASRLIQHVLTKEAQANGMDVSQLMAMPPGRGRRNLHDDLTAVIIFLGESTGTPAPPPTPKKGFLW